MTFMLFVCVNWLIVYTTVKFGPNEWRPAPQMLENLSLVLMVGIMAIAVVYWAFVKACSTQDVAVFWSGLPCETLIGFASIVQLVSRDNIRGHSFGIWYV